jgi:hypothetical protein
VLQQGDEPGICQSIGHDLQVALPPVELTGFQGNLEYCLSMPFCGNTFSH